MRGEIWTLLRMAGGSGRAIPLMETRPDLDVGLAGSRGSGRNPGMVGRPPIGSWTLRAEAWTGAGSGPTEHSGQRCRGQPRAATGCDVTGGRKQSRARGWMVPPA